MTYVEGNQLKHDSQVLGTFSSHWAACAAMIRLSDPKFRSLGGDKQEDLAVEDNMRALGLLRGIRL